jgi:uracil phosphoribosyltransferase
LIAAILALKSKRFFNVNQSKQGVENLTSAHPDVHLFLGAMDEKLDDHGYVTVNHKFDIVAHQ